MGLVTMVSPSRAKNSSGESEQIVRSPGGQIGRIVARLGAAQVVEVAVGGPVKMASGRVGVVDLIGVALGDVSFDFVDRVAVGFFVGRQLPGLCQICRARFGQRIVPRGLIEKAKPGEWIGTLSLGQ